MEHTFHRLFRIRKVNGRWAVWKLSRLNHLGTLEYKYVNTYSSWGNAYQVAEDHAQLYRNLGLTAPKQLQH
jgi:hypothetical protein